MSYNHREIEAKWQKYWAENQTFKAETSSEKPKYYVLDMFPYPSGAGLHVGHPLGYIASDIFARYKRHQGFNVLHPQGYDSFGLPAEQYAIQTGQHPAITTETNINRYREQLDRIGFSFDWSKEVRTSNADYYKWTQWIFVQLFDSYYCNDANKALPITDLVDKFKAVGNANINVACDEDTPSFSAADWNSYSEEEQQNILLKYRLTYLAETEVNWCPKLGTVLANDEIVNGVSERGGHPVIRKKMTQWSMRISAYAERLLQGLEQLDWTESLKETQRNWIGKSVGASVTFNIKDHDGKIEVFTTRPDTIFGVSFMTLAPEHDLVNELVTDDQKAAVEAYVEATAKRSERERMADVKTISGVFTGAYAEHPFTKEPIPIWIGDYVLASYGTGAVMAVPCGDQRDYDFAKHFNIDIPNIFEGVDISEEAFDDKATTIIANSDFINGLNYKEATAKVIEALEQLEQGYGKINYRLRDAVFSRQRYWGEPFPVYYQDGAPKMIATEHLPVQLPEIEKYLPTETGEPPLGRANVWAWDTNKNEVVSNDLVDNTTVFPLELNTMPGWAGSSWYLFRYMDATNNDAFASQEALAYWQNVDLYIGGSEHATGHLLYSRFWTKFLYDRGFLTVDEPFKKLINQGMILGTSVFYNYADFKVNISLKLLERHSSYPFLRTSESITELIVPVFYQNESSVDLDIIKKELIQLFSTRTKKPESIIAEELDISVKSGLYFKKSRRVPYDSVDPVSFKIDFDRLRESPIFTNAVVIADNNFEFICSNEVEKMSKSKYNVVNPDDICDQYGADTLRLYEMFLGPLEQAKPWNTAGITGVQSFIKKLWKLYVTDEVLTVTDAEPTKDNLKTLHKTIKKVIEDIENFSFNTSVSTFMICVNELTAQKCTSKSILESLAIIIAPYAPHIAEELWAKLGNTTSVAFAPFPVFEAKHLVESEKEYPISFNGKMRFKINMPLDLSKEEIQEIVMADKRTEKQLQGREPKKVIIVPGKIINIVG